MSAAIEREIRHLLNRSGSTDVVIDELVGRWRKNLLSPEDSRAVAQFMLACGSHVRVLDEMQRLLKERRAIPWAQFAEALLRARSKLKDDDLQALLEGLDEQDAFADILTCRGVDEWSKALRDKRRTVEAKKSLELAEKRNALRDRLQFFRNNRMYSEEAATLDQLRAFFPDDPEFKVEEKDLALRWAYEVLANRVTQATDPTAELSLRARQLTPETMGIKDVIVQQAKETAARQPQAAYDLSLLLFFMDFPREAVETLDYGPDEERKDWLRLELLLRAREYVAVLEDANRLEIQYAGSPESTFSIVYARARALWGLGQAAMAIDLMRSIVNVRPQYKSASSLLTDWTGGDA